MPGPSRYSDLTTLKIVVPITDDHRPDASLLRQAIVDRMAGVPIARAEQEVFDAGVISLQNVVEHMRTPLQAPPIPASPLLPASAALVCDEYGRPIFDTEEAAAIDETNAWLRENNIQGGPIVSLAPVGRDWLTIAANVIRRVGEAGPAIRLIGIGWTLHLLWDLLVRGL